jgi:hypothetical protein
MLDSSSHYMVLPPNRSSSFPRIPSSCQVVLWKQESFLMLVLLLNSSTPLFDGAQGLLSSNDVAHQCGLRQGISRGV